jgi:hypothetical protein
MKSELMLIEGLKESDFVFEFVANIKSTSDKPKLCRTKTEFSYQNEIFILKSKFFDEKSILPATIRIFDQKRNFPGPETEFSWTINGISWTRSRNFAAKIQKIPTKI